MSYIGQQPLNNFVTKQSQTFTPDGSTVSFTLNFAVTSGIDIMLVINNVVQEPGAGKAYTASGTTLTMSEAPGASDSMYCIFLGLALQTVNPGDASVGTSKLTDSAVTNAKIANSTIDLTTKATSYTAGITMADQWRLSANFTSLTGEEIITTNWERNDTSGFNYIGTGMTESSGVFTFPSTGIYWVLFNLNGNKNGDSRYNSAVIETTINNSSYNYASTNSFLTQQTSSNPGHGNATTQIFFDVTDTSNCKVRFKIDTEAAIEVMGNSTFSRTYVTFIRLGDT